MYVIYKNGKKFCEIQPTGESTERDVIALALTVGGNAYYYSRQSGVPERLL